MTNVILECNLAPGDVVMLTAAVRDLHRQYPGEFATDVRTLCPDLWLHNPQITSLNEKHDKVRRILCSYPLINYANTAPYHCLHGFTEFLSEQLGVAVQPTEFRGDIHLSAQERAWFSQVHELTGEDTPFWVLSAGGKYDLSAKWWDKKRFQEVVDYFRGKIQFVQVGHVAHYHPKLNGVIDLRGKTSLRELVRLVYHAEGVLSPVTMLMHLAAAVPGKKQSAGLRPCVVIAGGREPPHWEHYPGHQFIHTVGALPCCATGGCWKDRAVKLRDGDNRDRKSNLCTNLVGNLPRCMHMITSDEVIRRIDTYYKGGQLAYLDCSQNQAATLGVRKTRRNTIFPEELTIHRRDCSR